MNLTVYFRPLIPILISFIFGILIGSQFPGHIVGAFLFVIICAFLIIANLVLEKIEQKPAFLNKLHLCTIFTPFILFAALGYISIQPWINTQFPENHVISRNGIIEDSDLL